MDAVLKAELQEIAEILKQYPDSLQERVFEIAISGSRGATVAARESDTDDASGVASRTPGRKRSRKKQESVDQGAGSKKKPVTKQSPSVVSNLDLKASGNVPSFNDFVTEKSPRSNDEFNLVAAYYLTRLKGMPSASPDDIYTCYKAVKRKVPSAFQQSFRNTKTRHGYVDFDAGCTNITVTIVGENFVEQGLPHGAAE